MKKTAFPTSMQTLRYKQPKKSQFPLQTQQNYTHILT